MKKLFITTLLILGSINFLFSQQKPVIYSQYLFNALAVNPAYAGSEAKFSATALYRDQWVNLDGAPRVQTFSVNTAAAQRRVGLGLVISRDQVGVHNDLSLYASYAYRIKWYKGVLAMGLQAGFNSLKSDFRLVDKIDLNDPKLDQVFSRTNPNFGFGLFYSDKDMFVGFSVPYLLNNNFFDTGEIESDVISRRYYFLSAGKYFSVNHEVDFRPSFLLRYQEGSPLGIDTHLMFYYKRKVGLGTSYRSGDALIFNFELKLNENFSMGYAYEWVQSAQKAFNRGSHELMVNYRFDIPGLNKVVACPSYL